MEPFNEPKNKKLRETLKKLNKFCLGFDFNMNKRDFIQKLLEMEQNKDNFLGLEGRKGKFFEVKFTEKSIIIKPIKRIIIKRKDINDEIAEAL